MFYSFTYDKIRNSQTGCTVKQPRAAFHSYHGNKVIIIIIIILFCSPSLWEINSLRIPLNQWSSIIINTAHNQVSIVKLFTTNMTTGFRARCENPIKCGKARAFLLSCKRRARARPKRGRAGEASERISRAAIAGHVIGRKRNYGVHGATAASCGSRVITYYRRRAIVPAT